MGRLRIGKQSSIQDDCTLHTDVRDQRIVGNFVTVGHNVVIHGSKVQDHVIVGMNSTLLGGTEVGPNSMVAKGKPPAGVLLAGVPAKIVSKLDDSDRAVIKYGAEAYVELLRLSKEKS